MRITSHQIMWISYFVGAAAPGDNNDTCRCWRLSAARSLLPVIARCPFASCGPVRASSACDGRQEQTITCSRPATSIHLQSTVVRSSCISRATNRPWPIWHRPGFFFFFVLLPNITSCPGCESYPVVLRSEAHLLSSSSYARSQDCAVLGPLI